MRILSESVRGILAISGLTLGCWFFGLFNHFIWWVTHCMGSCSPFSFSSGLMKYTLPYALVGLLAGIAAFVGIVMELFEKEPKRKNE